MSTTFYRISAGTRPEAPKSGLNSVLYRTQTVPGASFQGLAWWAIQRSALIRAYISTRPVDDISRVKSKWLEARFGSTPPRAASREKSLHVGQAAETPSHRFRRWASITPGPYPFRWEPRGGS